MLQVLLLAWFAPGLAVAQVNEGFFDVELRHEHVAGNVYMIQRSDGFANVGVFVGDEGVLLAIRSSTFTTAGRSPVPWQRWTWQSAWPVRIPESFQATALT